MNLACTRLLVAASAGTLLVAPVARCVAQETPPEDDADADAVQSFAVEFPLRVGLALVDDALVAEGIARSMWEIGPELRVTLFRYAAIGVGMRGEFASDTAPFEEGACEFIDGRPTGRCERFESSVFGISFHAQAGALYRWMLGASWQGVALAALGYRSLALNRSIRVDCRDCTEVALHTTGGWYLSPVFDVIKLSSNMAVPGMGVELGGELFLSGSLVASSWLGWLVKFW